MLLSTEMEKDSLEELEALKEHNRILREGISLLQHVYRTYADKNLSFDDNWYENVESYFQHDFLKVKL
jgi:hypothetical protein